MTPTLLYIVKVNMLLSIVYLFYIAVLRKETFVKSNRQYFLIGIISSFLLPLITVTKTVYVEQQTVDLSNLTDFIENEELITEPISFWSQFTVEKQLFTVYLVITAVFLAWFITKSYRLCAHIRKLNRSSLGNNVLVDDKTNEAYSFWKWVVLPRNYEAIDRLDVVLEHEYIHVKQKHSIDILLIELVKTIFWFNPLLILLQKAINLNLEYIVDQEVSKRVDIYDYQMTLVQFEYNKIQPMTMVNSFSTSDLKKRVLMLNTQKSTIMKKLKFVMITPVVAGFFFFFQFSVKAKVLEKSSIDILESTFEESKNEELLKSYDIEEKRYNATKSVNNTEGQLQSKQEEKNGTIEEVETIKLKADQVKDEAERIRRDLEVRHTELSEMKKGRIAENKKIIEERKREEINERQAKENEKLSTLVEERRAQIEQRKKEVSAEIKARNERLEKDSAKRRAENEDRLKNVKGKKGKLQEQELDNTIFFHEGKTYTKDEFYALNLNPTDIKAISFYKKEDATAKFGTPSDKKVLEVSTNKSLSEMKKDGELSKFTVVASKQSKSDFEGIILVDGVKTNKEEMNEINSDRIESVSVLKGEKAIGKYGDLGAKGVIEIVLKK
ncbi:M56 family metallopeptidase [Myroides phaeus]|uniref:BlaR1 peptidase M56 n=1 Tax=Myroides phaeus TaxID=702745 RepID=A0A1G8G0W2_9FLAO|nr:M56 family metallopeptidase [Myroides phaeus]SDH88049.1 BlaR1 peptidase M56 [Myroides phaeus]